MIEIKSWRDGKVLYTAGGPADVRTTLQEAVKVDADLGCAKLGYANVTSGHPLWAFRIDLWSVLDQAPAEVDGLRKAIMAGKIDGSTYEGSCACLVGTIAQVAKANLVDLPIARDSSRPAEQWFMPIREGDKPLPLDRPLPKGVTEAVFRASWALVWVDEWVESRKAISRALAA